MEDASLTHWTTGERRREAGGLGKQKFGIVPGWPEAFSSTNSGFQKQRGCHGQQALKADPFLTLVTCYCFSIAILIGFQRVTVFTGKTQ